METSPSSFNPRRCGVKVRPCNVPLKRSPRLIWSTKNCHRNSNYQFIRFFPILKRVTCICSRRRSNTTSSKGREKPTLFSSIPIPLRVQFTFETFPTPGKRPVLVVSPRPTPYMDRPNLLTFVIREVKLRRYIQDKYEGLLEKFYSTT